MYKSSQLISQTTSRLARHNGAQLQRHAAVNMGLDIRSESRFAKCASRVMSQLVSASPLMREGLLNANKHFNKSAGSLSLSGLGSVRTFSDKLPPSSLIARYKPVLEDAISHRDELVELVENDNFCIASFVETALNLAPGLKSIQLDNGYSIVGIDETEDVTDTSAKIYDLHVMPPERLGYDRKPFKLQVTVYKANILKDAQPADLKMMLGLCSLAVNIHQGKLPRKLYSSVNVFSPTVKELGSLYLCADSVKGQIRRGQVPTPKDLLGVISHEMKLRHIDPKGKFVAQLRSLLIEEFAKTYPVHVKEILRLLEQERTPKPAVFQHSIDHKGGAYRAAIRLNNLAMINPEAGFSAVCVSRCAESGEQRFTIAYHPSGIWVEQKNSSTDEEAESIAFAKPGQLSEALKQRGVSVIISPSLGRL